MDWGFFHAVLLFVQRGVSFAGVMVIVLGVLYALGQYFYYFFTGRLISQGAELNDIRLHLGRILILGLEFIVAADLIGTTTAPDYYSVGLLGLIVLIRTVLSYSLNRELSELSKGQ